MARRTVADWLEAIEAVQQRRPGVAAPEWDRALANPNTLAMVIRDLTRVDLSPSKKGPRDIPELTVGTAIIDELAGDTEYTSLPFTEAFQNLVAARGLSMAGVARKISVSRSQAHRYITGERTPPVTDMAHIAIAFGKPATYFREYRALRIASAVAEAMEADPDRSAALCQSMH